MKYKKITEWKIVNLNKSFHDSIEKLSKTRQNYFLMVYKY